MEWGQSSVDVDAPDSAGSNELGVLDAKAELGRGPLSGCHLDESKDEITVETLLINNHP